MPPFVTTAAAPVLFLCTILHLSPTTSAPAVQGLPLIITPFRLDFWMMQLLKDRCLTCGCCWHCWRVPWPTSGCSWAGRCRALELEIVKRLGHSWWWHSTCTH